MKVLNRKSMQSKSDSKTRGSFKRHDHFFHKAKQMGFMARSVFKLEELDRDFKLLKPNDVVLDLGCAPGSWLQYVEKRVTPPKGRAFGIDLLPVKTSFAPHVSTLQKDVLEWAKEGFLELVDEKGNPLYLDVVLSDMAPNTTGVKSLDQDRSLELCRMALYIAQLRLKPKGNFCVKILEGGGFAEFIKECKALFKTVKIKKPEGTRSISMETYVIGLGKK